MRAVDIYRADRRYAGVWSPDRVDTEASYFIAGRYTLIVDCFHYEFNGTEYGRVSRSINIPKYDGLKALRTLPVYPMVALNDNDWHS